MKWVYTACAIFSGFVFMPALIVKDWSHREIAYLAPLLGFAIAGASVLSALWMMPSSLYRVGRREPKDWRGGTLAIFGILVSFAAMFMLWIPIILVLVGPLLLLPDELAAPAVAVAFGASVIVVGRTWQATLKAAGDPNRTSGKRSRRPAASVEITSDQV